MIFSPFSKQEIQNPKFYSNISERFTRRKALNFADYFGNGPEQNYWWNLKKRLEESFKIFRTYGFSETEFQKYRNLYLEICFFLLYRLEDKEIFDLIKGYFIFGMRSGIDVKERIHTKAQTIMLPDDRDKFLQEVRGAINENGELLGRMEINIQERGQVKKVKPYLKNWLKDFDFSLGIGKHSLLETANYFFKSSNVRVLSQEERKLLKNIIEFNELLKLKYNYPDSLSGVSADIIGFKKVGDGIRARYVPQNPQVLNFLNRTKKIKQQKKEEVVAPKIKRTEKLPEAKLVKPSAMKEKIVPERKVAAPFQARPVPLRPKKLEEGLSGPAIPQNSIVKLNSIDGLAQLSISDFRFFSQNPREAARFMFNKLRKLVMSSPAMRLQIQDSFKNSELYKLYLSQGKEIIDTGKTIGEITDLRRQQRREFMNEEEYRAVGAIGKAI